MGAVSLLLLRAPSASALPAELGDRCASNGVAADSTAIVLNNGLNNGLELPVSVPPEGSKVIARWRVQAAAGLEPIAQQIVVFKQVGEEDLKVGESALETVVGGANEFATRVPVPEYGHIGLWGPDGTLLCAEEPGHLAGTVEGQWGVGETRHFKVELNVGVPVIATVGPDADGDGFGDETQDGCPRSGEFVGDGGTKQVSPGSVTRFTIRLPKPVLLRLSRLTRRESIRAKLTLRATNAAGVYKNTRLQVKLRGWRRPR